jgi:putative CocE/NonD family hydrolase
MEVMGMQAPTTDDGRVSRFGEYAGYSEPGYDGWQRESFYVEVRDGTRLAVDVFRPTRDGVVADEALPVVWKAKRYLRATVKDGKLVSSLLEGEGSIADQGLAPRLLVSHGYVLASADMRGTGASFGNWTEASDPVSSRDGFDITEWLASQPWCDGKVGMLGASYEGRMQLNTAAAAPPHLLAIMPEVSPFDWYEIIHDGGMYEARFEGTGAMFRSCDVEPPIAPVDKDTDGSQLAEALAIHAANDYAATSGEIPLRDGVGAGGVAQWLERSGEALLPGIVLSEVATYQTTGFFARVGVDQLLWFANLERSRSRGRHKMLIGPWPHGGVFFGGPPTRQSWAVEALRFFDHWLKGVENGVMDEPPVRYSTQTSGTSGDPDQWRLSQTWPPADSHLVDFYLAAGQVPDGPQADVGLRPTAVAAEDGADELTVDDTLASPSRHTDEGFWEGGAPGSDYSSYDAACLTYTTEPLAEALELTGHPIVHLYLSASADDADVFVRLVDVHPDGVSTFVTQGRLRASYRAAGAPPYYRFDTPWHPSRAEDIAPIPAGEVVELAMGLLPLSYEFQPGHRVRLSVSGADTGYVTSAPASHDLRLTVHRGTRFPSRIRLPVVVKNDAR